MDDEITPWEIGGRPIGMEIESTRTAKATSNGWQQSGDLWIKFSISFRDSGLLAKLRGAPLSVLIAVGTRIDDKGECWPSVAKIAKDSGYSETEARSALKTLKDLNLVDWVERDGQSNVYVVLRGISAFNTDAPIPVTPSDSEGVRSSAGVGVRSSAPEVDTSKEETIIPAADAPGCHPDGYVELANPVPKGKRQPLAIDRCPNCTTSVSDSMDECPGCHVQIKWSNSSSYVGRRAAEKKADTLAKSRSDVTLMSILSTVAKLPSSNGAAINQFDLQKCLDGHRRNAASLGLTVDQVNEKLVALADRLFARTQEGDKTVFANGFVNWFINTSNLGLDSYTQSEKKPAPPKATKTVSNWTN